MFNWNRSKEQFKKKSQNLIYKIAKEHFAYNLGKSKRGYYNDIDYSSLAYKYGFVAQLPLETGFDLDKFSTLKGWPVVHFLGLEARYHPMTQCVYQVSGDNGVAVIGEVFNPYSKIFDAQQIVDELVSRLGSYADFLDFLDELSGRFVIFVKSSDKWLAHSDAFSTRSIFYDVSYRGLITSHASLAAELTGDSFDFNMLAFTQSGGYQKRDVKYLPGLRTMWVHIFYCPANHSIDIKTGEVARFWPRINTVIETAQESLISYLDGYSDYIYTHYDREIFGLTGGLDSRTLLAPLMAKGVPMTTFTFNRGDQGGQKDMQIARQISEALGVDHEELSIDGKNITSVYFSEVMQVLRQSSGHMRLNSPYGSERLYSLFKGKYTKQKLSYSRGFGGEILRGFYQNKAGKIDDISSASFSKAYDVLSGSPLVRDAFEHFIASSNFDELYGIDVNDIFYWEHRMSGWGAIAIAETDLTACTYVGYNSRRLYTSFLGNSFEHRTQRNEFKGAIEHFSPELLEFEIA